MLVFAGLPASPACFQRRQTATSTRQSPQTGKWSCTGADVAFLLTLLCAWEILGSLGFCRSFSAINDEAGTAWGGGVEERRAERQKVFLIAPALAEQYGQGKSS